MLILKNKKEKIILAAISEFAKEGFEKASVDTIALKAKVAKGTIFYHFKSKDKLFEKIVTLGYERFENKLEEEIKDIESNKDKIIKIIEIEIDFINKYKDLFLVYLNDTLKKVTSFKVIEDILNNGIKNGEFRKNLDVKTVSISLFWTTAMVCLNSKEVNKKEIINLFLNGIEKQQ